MSTTESLGLELRFRPNSHPEAWAGVLAAISAWAPELRPATALRLADPEQRKLPWSLTLNAAICQDCALGIHDGWLLTGSEGPIGAITIDHHPSELRFSLALPRPVGGLIDRLLVLLNAMLQIYGPAAAMAFDLTNQADSELVLQGLSGLIQLPPLLYLDQRAAGVAGGIERLSAAPCNVIDTPRGLLLVLRSDPWQLPTESDQRRIVALERYLGMGSGKPLILLDEEQTESGRT